MAVLFVWLIRAQLSFFFSKFCNFCCNDIFYSLLCSMLQFLIWMLALPSLAFMMAMEVKCMCAFECWILLNMWGISFLLFWMCLFDSYATIMSNVSGKKNENIVSYILLTVSWSHWENLASVFICSIFGPTEIK